MVKELQPHDVYGEVENLTEFEHPQYHRHFEFLTNNELIGLAKKTVDNIEKSGFTTVVTIESGTAPFIYICQRVAELTNRHINWVPIKFPREPQKNISPILAHYLADSEKVGVLSTTLVEMSANFDARTLFPAEKPKLENVLHYIETPVVTPFTQGMATLLSGTEMGRKLSEPFVLFDEYYDSGTTLRNYHTYFHLFTPNPDYMTGSYYANVEHPEDYPKVAFTLFNKSTQEECYTLGAYPYENRLDLIGYFYFINEEHLEKVMIDSFIKNENHENNQFLDELVESIENNALLDQVKKYARITPVAGSINVNHLVRFYLYVFENDTTGKLATTEFLWQLFELYGPIWSPLPDEYHLDYLSAFSSFENQARDIPNYAKLLSSYQQIRSSLLSDIASACENRRQVWLNHMEEDLKNYEF